MGYALADDKIDMEALRRDYVDPALIVGPLLGLAWWAVDMQIKFSKQDLDDPEAGTGEKVDGQSRHGFTRWLQVLFVPCGTLLIAASVSWLIVRHNSGSA